MTINKKDKKYKALLKGLLVFASCLESGWLWTNGQYLVWSKRKPKWENQYSLYSLPFTLNSDYEHRLFRVYYGVKGIDVLPECSLIKIYKGWTYSVWLDLSYNKEWHSYYGGKDARYFGKRNS